MPNNKIARIVREIEYRQPAGALPEYKYGLKIKRTVGSEVPETNKNIVIPPSVGALRRELSAPVSKPVMPTPELIDGE